MKLTEEQKQTIRENFKETPDLLELTRIVFQNQDIDGRSKEGRAVLNFYPKKILNTKLDSEKK